jgi:hypothetical protein
MICLYFATNQDLWAHKLMDRIMCCYHSLGWKEVLKFVYYLLFHDPISYSIYILNIFIVSTI